MFQLHPPLIQKFENKFNTKFRFNHSIALNSGTSALQIALKSIGVRKGDTVILPSYTFAATANAIIYNNAYPWFFDCDKNFNLAIDEIEKVLKLKHTIKIKKISSKKKRLYCKSYYASIYIWKKIRI